MTDIGRITRINPMRPVKPKANHGGNEKSYQKPQKSDTAKEDSSDNDNKKHIDEHV